MPAVPRPSRAPVRRDRPRATRARRRPAHQVRRALTRTRPALLGAVALVAGLAAARAVADADATRAAWGPTRRVAVATRDLAPAHPIERGDLAWSELPTGLVPSDAVTTDPIGTVVTERVLQGEPLRVGRLGPQGAAGLAALVPTGWRAVAVPRDDRTPAVQVGHTVELWAAAGDPGTDALAEADTGAARGSRHGSAAAGRARRLSERGRVIELADRHLTVAVPASDIAGLGGALVTDSVVVVLAGA